MHHGKVLITGGAGFIGSNLALKLLSKGYEVAVLDNLSPQIHGSDPEASLYLTIAKKVHFIKGDVTSAEDWARALQNIEVVVHLAAETGTGQSMYNIHNYVNVNVNGTALLLDYLANKKHSVQKVVIASSRAIYGEGKYVSEEQGIVYPEHRTEAFLDKGDFEVKIPGSTEKLSVLATDELSKLHPSSIYGITKLTQEQMVMTLCAGLKIPAVAFRYQNVYGPGQSLKNPYTGILSIFSTQIRNNKTLKIFEDGKESRDFVYIDDVVDATIAGIENQDANGEVFDVGSGRQTTVIEVAEQLLAAYNGSAGMEITGQYRIGDIRHNFADLSKITGKLGFTPSVSFSAGIKKFTDWVKLQEIEHDNYDKSIEELKAKGLIK